MKELDPGEKEQVAQINQLISTAKASWFALLSYLAFVGVTLMGVQDADFFIPSRETDLPLIGVSVPTSLFFYVAPILGAAIYVYFHLHLLKLWEPLARADHRMAGTPLSDRISPWLIVDFALSRRGDDALRDRKLKWFSNAVTVFLTFWAGPLVLFAFWTASMPKHDWPLTTLFIGLPLLVTMYVGKNSYDQLVAQARKTIAESQKWEWRIFGVFLSLFGLFAASGTNDKDPDIRAFAQEEFGWPARAELAGVEFTRTHDQWEDFETARASFRRDWCDAEGISKLACGQVDFRGSVLSEDLIFVRRNWCKDNLEAGRDCPAYFIERDAVFLSDWRTLRDAERARNTTLDLSGVDLRGADLFGARMEGADLSGARMDKDTSLTAATFQGAAVRDVDYTDVAISEDQIQSMFGDASVTLSAGMNPPAHWPDWELDWQTFEKEWRKWQADPDGYPPPTKPDTQ